MANRKRPIKSTSCSRVSDETRHLKPLSVYSHRVFLKSTSSWSVSPSCSPDGPPWNLKVEFSNSRPRVGVKRGRDDSCLDETYDTPLKKPCLAKRPPRDSSSAFRQVTLVSARSGPEALDEIKRIEKTLSDRESLRLGQIDGSNKIRYGDSGATVSDVRSSSPVIVHNKDGADFIAFDYNMDEIMCLSPIDRAEVSADSSEDFVRSCQTYGDERLLMGSWSGSEPKRGEPESSLGKDAQTGSDEGYVTKSYFASDPGESKVTTESESNKSDEMRLMKSYKITIQNSSNLVSVPVTSTPSAKFRELVKRSPVLRPNLGFVKTSSPSSLSAHAGNTDALPIIPFLTVNQSKELNVPLDGTPIYKSLACHNPEKRAPTQVKEDEDFDMLSGSQKQSEPPIQAKITEEMDAANGGFKSTVPVQVQVNLKTVSPNTQQPEAVKATARQQPEKKAASEDQKNVFRDVPRPVVLYREEDWEKEKRLYVDLVTRHMTDNVEDGVMTELLYLMNAVANQRRGSDGRKWQHPSDLTRRNYRLRKSSRLLSLDEWQNLNHRNHRRFAKVPQVFRRSPAL